MWMCRPVACERDTLCEAGADRGAIVSHTVLLQGPTVCDQVVVICSATCLLHTTTTGHLCPDPCPMLVLGRPLPDPIPGELNIRRLRRLNPVKQVSRHDCSHHSALSSIYADDHVWCYVSTPPARRTGASDSLPQTGVSGHDGSTPVWLCSREASFLFGVTRFLGSPLVWAFVDHTRAETPALRCLSTSGSG